MTASSAQGPTRGWDLKSHISNLKESFPMIDENCPFCSLGSDRIISESDYSLTILDGFPVSNGHTLIIPKRHVQSFFELQAIEKAAVLQALDEAKETLDQEFLPDGYNIGINDGEAAGQTVMHLHIHLIPRYKGDTEDPRGGVRHVFPGKAKYW
jgi:diadenosine tetraphosphate (Ap4A) HIT family hydrolase